MMLYSARMVEPSPMSSIGNEPLNELIERDYDALKRKALQIIGSRLYLCDGDTLGNAACTLIHDTYGEAKQKFAQFDPACGPFVKWYGGFMHHTFHRMLRNGSQQRLKLVQDSPVACDPLNWCLSFEDLDDDLIRRETVACILSHSHLNPFERIVVDLSYRRDWRGAEIARSFHLSPDYLRTKRQRALLHLRSIAQDLQQDEEAGEPKILSDPNHTRERRCCPPRRRVAGRGPLPVAAAVPPSPVRG